MQDISQTINPIPTARDTPQGDQHFYGHGKLLLSSEYFVLDGALSLALPTKLGQTMRVQYENSYNPTLLWKSYNNDGQSWFEAEFEFWHFDLIGENRGPEAVFLQKILRQARKQNNHFLRDEVNVSVETKLGFPLGWGLGSSSTLVYNIAQWAYISPYELLFNTYGGSGYDIACAQSDGPVLYQLKTDGPSWSLHDFNPSFKDQLYFVYLGRKQDSREGVDYYRGKGPYPAEVVMALSNLTREMLVARDLAEFDYIIGAHEELVSSKLNLKKVSEGEFSDFWGKIKSLGAWGGDFVLVTSDRGVKETKKYFKEKGHPVFFTYGDLILERNETSQFEARP